MKRTGYVERTGVTFKQGISKPKESLVFIPELHHSGPSSSYSTNTTECLETGRILSPPSAARPKEVSRNGAEKRHKMHGLRHARFHLLTRGDAGSPQRHSKKGCCAMHATPTHASIPGHIHTPTPAPGCLGRSGETRAHLTSPISKRNAFPIFFFSFSVFLTLPKYQINIRFEEVTAEHSSLPARRAAGCAGSLPRSLFTPRTPRAPFQQEKTGDFIAC